MWDKGKKVRTTTKAIATTTYWNQNNMPNKQIHSLCAHLRQDVKDRLKKRR
jgi:hypothetical protein